jgi:hypothetical protein
MEGVGSDYRCLPHNSALCKHSHIDSDTECSLSAAPALYLFMLQMHSVPTLALQVPPPL